MALSANSRLIFQQLAEGTATQAGALRGTVCLQVQVTRDAPTLVIEQLGLYGPGINTERGSTGRMSITGIPAQGFPLGTSASGPWDVDLPLNASVLYEAIERQKGFEKNGDRWVPDTETFSGRLQGALRAQEGSLNDFLFQGSLALEYRKGGLGWVRRLDLPFGATAVRHVPTPGLGQVRYKLRLLAVGYSEGPTDPSPSGSLVWQAQFQRAAAIWRAFGVQLDLAEEQLHVVENSDLKTSLNQFDVRLGFSSPDQGVIEFYFTSGLLADGGGITLSDGSALASVVLTDQNPHPDLLAHEIGHVLNGVHPGAMPNPGEWKGEPGSIMAVPVLGVTPSVPLNPDTLFRNAVLGVV